jgi:hypothetical protein
MSRAKPIPIPPTEALTQQLLDWAGERPRTYGEAMDAWRTSCPLLPIWEDAVDARLIEVVAQPGARPAERPVRLTARGRARVGIARWG